MDSTTSLPKDPDATKYHLISESQRFTKDELVQLYELVNKAESDNCFCFKSEGNYAENSDAYFAKVKAAELHLLQYKVMSYLAAEDSRLMNIEMKVMFD